MGDLQPRIARIHIRDLRLRAIIGVHDWERRERQDIVVNVFLTFDAASAVGSDDLKDTIDYKKLKQEIMRLAERSRFFLLEKLVAAVLDLALDDPRVLEATVRIDKPLALRFADSVSLEMTRRKGPVDG